MAGLGLLILNNIIFKDLNCTTFLEISNACKCIISNTTINASSGSIYISGYNGAMIQLMSVSIIGFSTSIKIPNMVN